MVVVVRVSDGELLGLSVCVFRMTGIDEGCDESEVTVNC